MLDFVASAGRARTLATTVHVGAPEGAHVDVIAEPWFDAGLRVDLVARALSGLDRATFAGALPWLSRGGGLDQHDADLQWCAASLAAFARFGRVPPGFFVVTRRGWLDVLSGQVQRWERVRPERSVGWSAPPGAGKA